MSDSIFISSSSDIEEGEIQDDEDLFARGVPTHEKGKAPSLHLEDLSSWDEVFSSDSMKSSPNGKSSHFTTGRRGRSAATQVKEKEKTSEPSKRKCYRKHLEPHVSVTMKKDLKQDDKNISRRHLLKRKHRRSVSTDSEDDSRKEKSKFNSRRQRDSKRIRTSNIIKKPDVKSKVKSPIRSRSNARKPRKKVERTVGVFGSCPGKPVPKSSLKKRLMHMGTFSNTEGEQIPTVEIQSNKTIETDLSITKEPDKSLPVKNDTEPANQNKQSDSKVNKHLQPVENSLKIQEKPVGRIKVIPIEKLQKAVEIATCETGEVVSPQEKIAIIAVDTSQNAGLAADDSLAADDDLAVLRKLALESTTSAANNRKATQKEPLGVDEDLDDLTELRLQALRSAILKKHNARKAKAAASALTSANAESAAGSPTEGREALAVTIPEALPLLPVQNSPHTNSNQCDQQSLEYDKTTLIVDMDLENTSDEESPPESNSFTNSDSVVQKQYMEPFEENISPYYIPEQWTPIIGDDDHQETKRAENTFHETSYGIGSGYENASSFSQLHLPFTSSLCNPQPVQAGLQPLDSIPPQVYHQQISLPLVSQPTQVKTTRNKYSVRPNLVALPMAPVSKDNLLIRPSNVNVQERLCDPTASFPTDLKIQSTFLPQVSSSLIQINLNAGTARDRINLNDKKEVTNRKTTTANTDNHKQGEQRASNEVPSCVEPADTSDAENMDISSMIVVDEIICTSPEPENAKSSVPVTVPMPTLNVLTDVPVPSSRYTSRSVVHNNAPLQIVHSPKHKVIRKQEAPLVNPFTINNLKKDILLRNRLSLATSASGNPRLLTSNQSKSYLKTAKSNQMSYISDSQAKHVPVKNKESSARFVIHLGDDSDSEDDCQFRTRGYVPLPARTIINERALPLESHSNQQNALSTTHDPLFSAKLDAFLKDTREKYERKAALTKQKEMEKVSLSAPSTLVSKTSSANKTDSTSATVKVPAKAVQKTATIAYANVPASTIKMPVKATQKTSPVAVVAATATATASSTRASVKMPVKGIQQPEICAGNSASSSGSLQSLKITVPFVANKMADAKTVNNQPPKKVGRPMVRTVFAEDNRAAQTNKTCASRTPLVNVPRDSLPVRKPTVLVPTSDAPKPARLIEKVSISSLVNDENNASMKHKMTSNVENEAQLAPSAKKTAKRNLTASINDMTLELAESKLMKERTSLLLDLTLILDHLNESSKVEQAINEMQETIAQQKQIMDLAQRTINITLERIASAEKKKEHTFKLINDKRKIVSRNRDLCNKMRTECINLGTKLKGQSYSVPQPLQTELRLKLEDVAAGIMKTIKDVSPQKRGQTSMLISPSSSPSDQQTQQTSARVTKSTFTHVTSYAQSVEPQDPSEGSTPVFRTDKGGFDIIRPNSRSNEDDFSHILILDCPYEINGICGDVSDCPFIHKKHR